MNSLPITEKFKDQSNYLVAFLASVIGLGAFKDSLSSIHIKLFSWDPSLFNLATFLVLVLLVSAYLSALALLADNLNFSALPLKGYLSFGANLTGAFALISPIFFFILWGLSAAAHQSSLQLLESTAVLSTLISALSTIAVFFSYRVTINNRNQVQETNAINAVSQLSFDGNLEITKIEKIAPKDYNREFLINFEHVSKYIKDYLDIKGYGVKNAGFHQMVKTLVSQRALKADDLKKSRKLMAFRNDIIHASRRLTKDKFRTGIKHLDEIEDEILLAFRELISEQGDV